ncbi:hypothetical protein TorRG33x02_293330 [Trema orientale]|uniref:Uncharacterized protein n=1 Tax=Trema orientale TaxID=63057 RepID=A0A2P5C9D2_TREOI|nr:hypothetical protein TorRG33x02_293330 [Trema orientale]
MWFQAKHKLLSWFYARVEQQFYLSNAIFHDEFDPSVDHQTHARIIIIVEVPFETESLHKFDEIEKVNLIFITYESYVDFRN